MFSREITKKAVIYLRNRLSPEFLYFVYPESREELFDALYFSDTELSEYATSVMENELSAIVGRESAITNLKYTDMDFADEMVHAGELIYVKNEKKLKEYLSSLYADFEKVQLQRRILVERMNECGSVFLQ